MKCKTQFIKEGVSSFFSSAKWRSTGNINDRNLMISQFCLQETGEIQAMQEASFRELDSKRVSSGNWRKYKSGLKEQRLA